MRKKKIKEILLVLGSVLWLSGCSEAEEMIYYSGDTTETTYSEAGNDTGGLEETPQILVYVCGAVQEPGVVAIDEDARIVDAILLAGGMCEEAAEDYVNLAAKLTDGEKIYIPTKAEVAKWEAAAQADTRVNINTADIDALCILPGIGVSKAEDIIAYREKKGSFKSLEELMEVSGIKENLYEGLADRIKLE